MAEDYSPAAKAFIGMVVSVIVGVIVLVGLAFLVVENKALVKEVRGIAEANRVQSETNQKHIDCLGAALTERQPPHCNDVIEQLRRDGIVP
jgi:hypothetical protein